jgi:hypothetical protein
MARMAAVVSRAWSRRAAAALYERCNRSGTSLRLHRDIITSQGAAAMCSRHASALAAGANRREGDENLRGDLQLNRYRVF